MSFEDTRDALELTEKRMVSEKLLLASKDSSKMSYLHSLLISAKEDLKIQPENDDIDESLFDLFDTFDRSMTAFNPSGCGLGSALFMHPTQPCLYTRDVC